MPRVVGEVWCGVVWRGVVWCGVVDMSLSWWSLPSVPVIASLSVELGSAWNVLSSLHSHNGGKIRDHLTADSLQRFPQDEWSSSLSGKANGKRNRERAVFDLFSN